MYLSITNDHNLDHIFQTNNRSCPNKAMCFITALLEIRSCGFYIGVNGIDELPNLVEAYYLFSSLLLLNKMACKHLKHMHCNYSFLIGDPIIIIT